MNTPSIRLANIEDLEALTALRIAFLRDVGNLTDEADVPEMMEATHRYLAEKMPTNEFMAWVAEVDGHIVAMSGLVFYERLALVGNPAGLHAYVLNMYTVPEFRRRGLASALLRDIIAYVKENTAAKRIWLHATDDGRPVYEKLGFGAGATEMVLKV